MSEGPSFRPAKPWGWVIRAVQTFLRFDLAWRNRLRLEPRDLDVLRALPRGAGVILAANHADETDFKACLELSRRSGRRFLFMMNREAFDEGYGVAGWWLQRLGAFSVERGGLHNEEAKRYAIEVVMRGREVLVIFPEGEIYYLNDLVQPFKSGAVDIGMQAVVEARRTRPDWTAYLVPMALKYRYREPIAPILERRTRSMERRLNLRIAGLSLQRRLAQIMADLLRRQELAHHLRPAADRLTELGERVQEVRKAILSRGRGEVRRAPQRPRPRRWTGRGGSVPTCGACWPGGAASRRRGSGAGPRGPRELGERGPDGGLAASIHRRGPVAGAAGGDGHQAGARGLPDQATAATGQAGSLPSHRRAHRREPARSRTISAIRRRSGTASRSDSGTRSNGSSAPRHPWEVRRGIPGHDPAGPRWDPPGSTARDDLVERTEHLVDVPVRRSSRRPAPRSPGASPRGRRPPVSARGQGPCGGGRARRRALPAGNTRGRSRRGDDRRGSGGRSPSSHPRIAR